MQLIKFEADVSQILDQKARRFHNVDVHNEDVLLGYRLDLGADGIEERSGMPELHLLCELAREVRFEVKHAVVLAIARYDVRDGELRLLRVHVPQKSEEFFE